LRIEAQEQVPRSAAEFDWNAGLRSALNAGAVAAVLASVPIRSGFLFALPIAGFLCVLFYRRRSSAAEPSPGAGFRLGAIAGFFGFAIFIMLAAVETVAFHAGNELREALVQAVKQAQERAADPQSRQMMEYFLTPGGLIFMMIIGFIFMLIAFALLSGMGGSISAALLRRKSPPS